MSGTASRCTKARSLLTLLAAGLAIPGAALAKSPATGLAACAAIEADLDRLACYDRATGRKAVAKPAVATSTHEAVDS